MSLEIRSLDDAREVGSILGDAAREIGLSLLRFILRPAFAFARFVDRCDE